MRAIRVLIADDHGLVRAGIRALLQDMESVEVVAEAGDGRQAIDLLQKHRPDVVLMDIGMAGMNGLDATIRIAKEYPGTRVIMLSMHANEEYVLQSIRAGASGYLLKDSRKQELEFAIRSVAQGKMYLSPEISRHVIERYAARTDDAETPFEQLTPRQREILQLVAEGRTNKEIACLLKVSIKTVDTHRTQLMERLNIHDVTGLVRYAIKIGLVSADR
ncbi:MAG: response regulator transcription factor [Acidobacteria bacterium]|nr:response regulator transcription factor [Acidobacteriota bacterium]